MSDRERVLRDVVIANRILAHQGVVDAYGHVSIRNPANPERFFLSRSRSPELVEERDIMEFTLDGKVFGDDRKPPYLERFIHGGIYEARPDVNSVVHSHAEETLAFGITGVPLKPVIHVASAMGGTVPIWDIADRFGDDTNLLVVNQEQGRDLAKCLGSGRVALMRGHGFAAAGATVQDAVRLSVYLPVNARVVAAAMRLGPYRALSHGEINQRGAGGAFDARDPVSWRAWEYWARRAGCAHLLGEVL